MMTELRVPNQLVSRMPSGEMTRNLVYGFERDCQFDKVTFAGDARSYS